MKKQWFADRHNGIYLIENKREVAITTGDFRSGVTRTVTFDKYLVHNPHPSDYNAPYLGLYYDQVCRAIRQLDMTSLTDEAVCWANLANE